MLVAQEGQEGEWIPKACSSFLCSHPSQPQLFYPVGPGGDTTLTACHSLSLVLAPGWQNCQIAVDRPCQLLC